MGSMQKYPKTRLFLIFVGEDGCIESKWCKESEWSQAVIIEYFQLLQMVSYIVSGSQSCFFGLTLQRLLKFFFIDYNSSGVLWSISAGYQENILERFEKKDKIQGQSANF